MPGPLAGLKVVEMVGLGPAPFAAMLLADQGAEVLRIDRPGARGALGLEPRFDIPARSRRGVALNLREPAARAVALGLVARADVLIEGFRPGVMERLGLGPEPCLARNPKLVYGRMTGWGQTGPLAQAAGHDINYAALGGALHAIGRAGEAPPPPLNFVADYGGGAMLLAFGVLAAVYEAQRSGRGQVIDAAMTDGVALLSAMFLGMQAAGAWQRERASNLLDGAAPFYDCYLCADGKAVSIGPLEPQFFAELLQRLGIDAAGFGAQDDRALWPQQKARLAALFATQPRAHWCDLLEGSDACFAPVLDWDEAPRHPHHLARGSFVAVDGVTQPAPAPRFSRTPAGPVSAPRAAESDPQPLLRAWGIDEALLAALSPPDAGRGA